MCAMAYCALPCRLCRLLLVGIGFAVGAIFVSTLQFWRKDIRGVKFTSSYTEPFPLQSLSYSTVIVV